MSALKVLKTRGLGPHFVDPDAAQLAFGNTKPQPGNYFIQVSSAYGHEIEIYHMYAEHELSDYKNHRMVISMEQIKRVAAVTLEFDGRTFGFAGIIPRARVDDHSSCDSFAELELYYLFTPITD